MNGGVELSDPLLAIEHRSGAVDLDRQRGQRHQRQQQDQHDGADDDVAEAFQQGRDLAGGEVLAQQEIVRGQRVQIDAAEIILLERGRAGDPHAAELAIQQGFDSRRLGFGCDHDTPDALLAK